jgi:RNA polymerase sigma-70 factor (ECF subfamily)
VVRAGHDPTEARRQALGHLLHRYLGAFRSFLMVRFRMPRDRAEDVVQGFVLSQVLDKNLIGGADAARGRFRNFLMTALERYAISEFRKESAQQRQGGRAQVDVQEHQDRLAGQGDDPAVAFDVVWATEVVRQAIERMRQATQPARPDLWGVFHDRMIGPMFEGSESRSYATLIGRLGFKDESQAASALKTAKHIFARFLRGVVAEYTLGEDEVDREIGELMLVLGTPAR